MLQVVLLTDGVCIGACSTFVSHLAFSGAVKTVTFGGGVDGVDVSGAPGSQSNEWDLFARDTALSAVVALMLGHAPCLPRSSNEGVVCAFGVTDLPLPLPTTGYVRFALANYFEPYLGPRALPREFYQVQADIHMPLWVRDPGFLPGQEMGNSSVENQEWDIVRAWTAAHRAFGRCPHIDEWRHRPQYGSGIGEGIPVLSVPVIDEGP